VAQCAFEVTPGRGWSVDPEDASAVAHMFGEEGRALTATRRARLTRVTPDRLRYVLALYEGDPAGIRAVMDKFGHSERNARRLVARARKELR
jgi:hypothetical protein